MKGWAAGFLGTLFLVALLADVLASHLPLLLSTQERFFFLPCVTQHEVFRGKTNQLLRAELEPGEWLLAPPIPYGPDQTFAATDGGDAQTHPAPPSAEHWLGTDELGRDVLARLIHGARSSLWVALLSVGLALIVGVLLGALAGQLGGAWDLVISRVIEVALTFPTFILILAVMGTVRSRGVGPVVFAIALTQWAEIARLVRGEVLRVKALPFVEASRALGASRARQLVVHVLPHAMAPAWVAASFGVGAAILAEGALSFLGLGLPPPRASWGELLLQAQRYLLHPGAWWLALFPGLALTLTVGACQLWAEQLQAKRK